MLGATSKCFSTLQNCSQNKLYSWSKMQKVHRVAPSSRKGHSLFVLFFGFFLAYLLYPHLTTLLGAASSLLSMDEGAIVQLGPPSDLSDVTCYWWLGEAAHSHVLQFVKQLRGAAGGQRLEVKTGHIWVLNMGKTSHLCQFMFCCARVFLCVCVILPSCKQWPKRKEIKKGSGCGELQATGR